MRSRRRPPLTLAIGLAIGLSGCARSPNDDSRYLADPIVPTLTGWAQGSAPYLDLARIVRSRGYDDICIVSEYSSLAIIRKSAGVDITDYHSDFGRGVGESKWAIVAVKQGKAHAALGDGLKLNLYALPGRLCVPADQARLVRLNRGTGAVPTARLEGSDAVRR